MDQEGKMNQTFFIILTYTLQILPNGESMLCSFVEIFIM